jgi:hypothetical protein
MRISTCTATSLGLVLTLGAVLVPAPAHAHGAARALVTTMRLDPTARVLDMSLTGATLPPRWSDPTFDDSSWDHPQPVAPRVLACVRGYMGSAWTTRVAYWGPNGHDAYLVRQTVALPRAHDYYGSELDLTAMTYLSVNVNGHALGDASSGGYYKHTERYALAAYLHSGVNVIAAYARAASTAASPACSALMYTVTFHATGVH